MTVTNPELRARLIANMPGLAELEPDDLEYFLQIEEDIAESRATGVMPQRLADRIAESRTFREEPQPYDESEEAEWAAAIDAARSELEEERSRQRQPKETQPARAKHKAVS